MASVDIINATGQAYIKVWEERSYLARMMLVPVLIKLACYTLALGLGYQDNILRLTLFLVPSYFAEGWVLAHLARLIFLGQRWPFQPTGNEKQDALVLQDRARGIMSGLVGFVLINILMGGYIAVVIHFMPTDPEAFAPHQALIGMMMVVFALWAFRLIWLYVPLAINCAPLEYLKKVNGFLSSFYLIGIWLLCAVPIVIAMQFTTSLTLASGESGGGMLSFVATNITVIFDSIKNVLATAGIAYGLKEIMEYKDRA